jgi:hypothetical protein
VQPGSIVATQTMAPRMSNHSVSNTVAQFMQSRQNSNSRSRKRGSHSREPSAKSRTSTNGHNSFSMTQKSSSSTGHNFKPSAPVAIITPIATTTQITTLKRSSQKSETSVYLTAQNNTNEESLLQNLNESAQVSPMKTSLDSKFL